MKLPVLVEHFNEHKEKNNKLSLLEFLSNHYTQDDNDGDDAKEMDLPFKSHDGCINTMVIAFMPTNFEGLSTKPSYTENNNYSIYTEKFLTSAHLSSIWQPPKSC